MMDNSAKVKEIMTLIENGEYFTINRPRQYGKTTTLHFLAEELKKLEPYLSIEMNFQGIDEQWHQSDNTFAQMFMQQLQKALKFTAPDAFTFLKGLEPAVQDMDNLSDAVTELVYQLKKKVVLIIDEVDASSNFLPFLNFLGMLRTKYMARFRPHQATFHSIVLAGVHDIKMLKYKLRPEDQAEYNSPWNIAADFKVDMSFNPIEIAPMLEEYCQAEGVKMNIPAIAGRLHYYTSGYPFLVSKLCKTIAEDILPGRTEQCWTLDDVEQSVQLLLKENNTNFDSLIKNMENNPGLYDLVHRVIINGDNIPFNPDEPITHLGRMYGIFKSNDRLKIHNRLYEQRLYNYMVVKTLISLDDKYDYGGHFVTDDNRLDLEAVLLKFQHFMKMEYSQKDKSFLERHGRLVFLSFLNPILNGKGHAFKEVEISEEKRLDITITFYRHKYIVELKRWYGEKYHQKGIKQLSGYLDAHGLAEGYVVVFEYDKEKSWRQEWIEAHDKRIFAVWV